LNRFTFNYVEYVENRKKNTIFCWFLFNSNVCSKFITGQLSVANSAATEDLFVESELTETLRSDIEKWIDQSKLSVMNVTCAKTNELEKSVSAESKSSSVDVSLSQLDNFEYKPSEYVPGAKSHSIGDNLERLTLSDDSSEKSFSYIEDDKHSESAHFQVRTSRTVY
jgi:hypothetical protein